MKVKVEITQAELNTYALTPKGVTWYVDSTMPELSEIEVLITDTGRRHVFLWGDNWGDFIEIEEKA